MTQQLILASSSPYRKELLEKITDNFICISPNIDETRKKNESASDLVQRLATEKAMAVADDYPDALIIGSDQVCEFIHPTTQEPLIIGKPKNHAKAFNHLKEVSGQSVTLKTGLSLYDAKKDSLQSCVELFHVTFRELSDDLIEKYLIADQPYSCAGSVKAESLGIILIEKMSGDDPNALIGLPLIQLTTMLNNQGFSII
ncbi:MAG: Maf family protein [Arenicella sp.]